MCPIGIRKRAFEAACDVKMSPVWATEIPESRAYRGKKEKRAPHAYVAHNVVAQQARTVRLASISRRSAMTFVDAGCMTGGGVGNRGIPTTIPAATTTADTRNAARNPAAPIAPPSPGPSAIPRYMADVYHPYALPRNCGGATSPTYDIMAGAKQASPTPENR